jgi:hypothetical protein
MKPAAVVGLFVAIAIGCCSLASASSSTGRLLRGYVQVVVYPKDDFRICPDYAIALAGPPSVPPCRDGLPAIGVDFSALTNHIEGHAARWGYLYLVGRYRNGKFYVVSQRRNGPRDLAGPSFATPPCAAPPGSWRLVAPSEAQRNTIAAYRRRHAGDITSVAFFHDATIPVIASTHPTRTRAALGRFWPRQLCVVSSRYSHATIERVRKRMVGLLATPSAAARYGWVTGAGGISCNGRGQPTTPLDVLIETPGLRGLLRHTPPGLVVVQPTLRPVRG